jgi:hypothetical protein
METMLLAVVMGLATGLVSATAAAAPKLSYEWAAAEADKCPTDVSWAENLGHDQWLPMCQFDDGETLALGAAQDRVRGFVDCDGHCDENPLAFQEPTLNSCEAKAELEWTLASMALADADAAYEDAYASCTE